MLYKLFPHWSFATGNQHLNAIHVQTNGATVDTASLAVRTECQLQKWQLNPLKPELNPICYLLALLTHHFLHVTRIRVKSLTIRLLMSYIYMEHLFLMFLDHTQRRSTVCVSLCVI